jgi:hypothetical protein
MGRFKEISKQCGKCGVEWEKDLINKKKGRALCIACYQIEAQQRSKEQVDKRHAIGAAVNRIAIYKDYKFENRQGFWRAINKEIKLLKNRDEIRAFISKQMDRILGDENLMKYLNSVTIAEQRNEYRNNKQNKTI